MKLRSIFSLLVGFLVANTGSAATTTTTLDVSATLTAACSVSAIPINFTVPANFGPFYYPANGSIDTTCPSGTPYSIALNGGMNYEADGVNADNFVTDGQGNGMAYLLFSDSSFNTVWGDDGATNPGSSVTSSGTGSVQTYTVYGGALPVYPVGSPTTGVAYSDVVTVTVNY